MVNCGRVHKLNWGAMDELIKRVGERVHVPFATRQRPATCKKTIFSVIVIPHVVAEIS